MPYNSSADLTTTTNQQAAAQATASKTAGAAGVQHVAKRIMASVATGATAQVGIHVNLRDGATGAGTILASWDLGCPANSSAVIDVELANNNFTGTAATAMTLEFSGATVANSVCSCTLVTYDK